jgi:hypothetical protein
MSRAGPGNDIHAGSPGSQKAPTQDPASLVAMLSPAANSAPRLRDSSACGSRPLAAMFRFDLRLALRLLARMVLLDLAVFFTWASDEKSGGRQFSIGNHCGSGHLAADMSLAN